MNRRGLWLLKIVLMCIGHAAATARAWHEDRCDMSTSAKVREGNMGQSGVFNWIGVLRVHLHDGDSVQVAMTGLVLVKMKYAIANADDIVRIPQRIFTTDTQAMFLPAHETPWFATPLSYVSHPEYEYSTTNTIALIELDIEKFGSYPLMPICLPAVLYNTSSHLYLTGYTDENKYLEKVVYKIDYLPQETCEEFYNRAGLSQKTREPSTYLCGYSPFNKTQCVWDNGMALVSNATGWFNLIGFGIRGPGCAAPARFINIHPYISWINSVIIQPEEIYDSPDYRRQEDSDYEYVPTHELFKLNESARRYEPVEPGDGYREYTPYPFNTDKLRFFNIVPHDENALGIYPFNGTLELYENACNDIKVLMYREYFELKADKGGAGTATYKISLYSLISSLCVCVIVHMDAQNHDDYILSVKEDFSFDEGTQLGDSDTPEEIFHIYPIYKIQLPKGNKTTKWRPNEQLRPQYLKQFSRFGQVLNYDLYMKFEFIERVTLKFEIWGYAESPTTSSTPTTTYIEIQRRKGGIKKAKNKHWGMDNVDFRVKQPVVTVVQQPAQEIQETVSLGNWNCSSVTFIIVALYLSWLI